MIEIIKSLLLPFIEVISPVLPHLGVIVAALLISGGTTQLVKYGWRVLKKLMRPLSAQAEEMERAAFELLAVFTAFVPCYSMWGWPHPVWASMAVGVMSPVLYKLTIGYMTHKYPYLEKVFSASPRVEIRRDEDGNIIAVKEGDDPTETIPRR